MSEDISNEQKTIVPEPFEINLDAMAVPPDRKIKVVQMLTTILVGKPSPTDFFYTRSGEGFEPLEFYTYSPGGMGKDSKQYLVMPACHSFLDDLKVLIPAKFYLYQILGSKILKLDMINQKVKPDGSRDRNHETHQEAVEAGMTQWVRMRHMGEGGFYVWSNTEDSLPNPSWEGSPKTLKEAILIAFKGRVITDMDHPEIRKLRGCAVVPATDKVE